MRALLVTVIVFSTLSLAAAQSSGKQSVPQLEEKQAPPARQQKSTHARQQISCPVSAVRTEITTPLPDPWWRTPQEGNLLGTTIQTIGGNSTLVCQYWAYGGKVSVMRLPPAGMSCQAVNKGFLCQ